MCDSSVKEIITLQFGHYANYIGSHWWNFQEASFVYDTKTPTDLNHDYFFQSGKTHLGQETFTPRLVLVDSHGSMGGLSITGSLYSEPVKQDALTPSSNGLPCTMVSQQPYNRNAFLEDLHQQERTLYSATQNMSLSCNGDVLPTSRPPAKVYDLRNSVHCWSDFLRPHFHPDTVCLLPGVWHSQVGGCADGLSLPGGVSGAVIPRPREGGGSAGTSAQQNSASSQTTQPSPRLDQLWSFAEGVQAARAENPYEDISDAIRRLAERSNCVQGFQVLCHGYDGMGGAASVTCELLQDDYSSKTVLCLPAIPPTTSLLRPSARTPLLVNTLMALSSLGQLCDVMLPLNLRQHAWRPDGPLASWNLLAYQPNSLYESSSLLASFLECFTSALRTRESPLTLHQLAACLTPGQQKVVSGRLQLPARPTVTGGGEGVSGGVTDDTSSPLASIVTRRGHNCPSSASGAAPLWQLRDPLHTGSPFPTQMITGLPLPPGIECVSSISCEASLVQSTESREFVRQLLQDSEKLRPAQLACYGVATDGWQQSVTDWRELAENYGEDKAEEEDSD